LNKLVTFLKNPDHETEGVGESWETSEYDSELGKSSGMDILIQDVLARIPLVLDQDGRYLIPGDSSSLASGDRVDDWVLASWNSPSINPELPPLCPLTRMGFEYAPVLLAARRVALD